MHPPPLDASEDAARRHDVFISYSHAQAELAQALKRSIEGFSKKWYQVRGRRVFLDEASLSTGTALEESVVHALGDSTAFLLISSEAASRSEWVNRELEAWTAARGTRNLFMVLADGELIWDRHNRRFDPVRSTALPPALKTAFPDEPLWEDLRNVEPKTGRDRILSVTAGIISAISGTPKDQLYGESIRQQRAVKRIAMAVAATMTLLVASLVGVSVAAIHQRNVARANRDIANADAMAASSRGLLASRLSNALFQALQARQIHDDPYTRASLLQGLSYDGRLVRYFHTRAYLRGIVWAGDTGQIILWARGILRLGNVATGVTRDLPLEGAASSVVASPNGQWVAVGTTSGDVELISVPSAATTWRKSISSTAVTAVGFSPDGATIAAATATGEVTLLAPANGGVLAHRQIDLSGTDGHLSRVAFTADAARLVLITDAGDAINVAAGTLTDPHRTLRSSDEAGTKVPTALVSTVHGSSIVRVSGGSLSVSTIAGGPTGAVHPKGLPHHPGAFTMATDGKTAAVESNGTVTVYRARTAATGPRTPLRLLGAATFGSDLAVSPTSSLLASSYGKRVGIWNLRGYSGIARSWDTSVARLPGRGGHQTILSDARDHTAIVVASDQASPGPAGSPGDLACWKPGSTHPSWTRLGAGQTVTAIAWNRAHTAVLAATNKPLAVRVLPLTDGCPVGPGSPAATLDRWPHRFVTGLAPLADTSLLVLLSGGTLVHLDDHGLVLRTWRDEGPGQRAVSALAVSPDGREVLLGHADGLVEKYSFLSGDLVRRWGEKPASTRVSSVTFVNPTLVAAAQGAGDVSFIDRAKGTLLRQLPGAQGFALSAAAHGSMVIGTQPAYGAVVWASDTGRVLNRFTFGYAESPALDRSSQRQAVATSVVSDAAGYVWFATPGSPVVRWDFNPDRWNQVACNILYGNAAAIAQHPDSKGAASCSG